MVLRKNSSLLHLNEEEIRDGVKTTKVVSGYESITPYVIGILISQGILVYYNEYIRLHAKIYNIFDNNIGQHFLLKRLTIRLAVGAWCCGCFILVQIYCSTLTSHLTSPNQKPLVNSFFEISDTPGVSLAVEKGYAIDNILKASAVIMFRFLHESAKPFSYHYNYLLLQNFYRSRNRPILNVLWIFSSGIID